MKVLDKACTLTLRERQRQVRGERRRLGDPDLFKETRPYDLVFTGELEMRVEERYTRPSRRLLGGIPCSTAITSSSEMIDVAV